MSFLHQYTDLGKVSDNQKFGADDRILYADFGSGFLAYNEKFWFGASVYHLNMPNQTFIQKESRLPIKYNFIFGYKIPLIKGRKITLKYIL